MPRVASILFKMYHAWHEPYHATSGKWSSATRGILTHEWHKNLRCRATCGIASFHACTTHGKRCYRHVPRVTHGRRVRREATRGTKARRGAARAVRSHAWHLWCWWWWCAHSLRITSGRLPIIWGSIPLCWSPTRTLHTYIVYIRHRLKLRQSPPGATPAAESVASRI